MAGKDKNLDPMWQKLAEKRDLEPPTPLDGNIYLGCKQNDVSADDKMLQNKMEMYNNLFQGVSMDATGNLTDISKSKAPVIDAGGDSLPGQVPTLSASTCICTERGGG